MEKKTILSILPEKFGICYLDRKSDVPSWVIQGDFFSITKTDNELSIVFPQDKIPAGILYEKDWRAFKIEDVANGMYSTGIISFISKPLSDNGISIFNISTYQTNYIFIEEKNLIKAKNILSEICDIKS